jgi:hypothetical protein
MPDERTRRLLGRVAWVSFAVGVPLGVFFAPLSREQLETILILCAAGSAWLAGTLIGDFIGTWLLRLTEGRFVRRA